MRCWIILGSPGTPREYKTIPAGDRRSLAGLRARGWTLTRVIHTSLPWPARQRLESCTHGHAELTR